MALSISPTVCMSMCQCVAIVRQVHTLAIIKNVKMILIFAIERRDCENCIPWPTFWRSPIKNVNLWNGNSWRKNAWNDFCRFFNIYHQIVSLRKLYSITLNYFLKVKNLKRLHFYICQQMTPLRKLYPWHWPTFPKVKKIKLLISWRQLGQKMRNYFKY